MDTAAAPGEFREPGDFEDKVSFFLGEGAELREVGDFESGDDGVVGDRGGIDDPAVGDDVAEFLEIGVAKFAAPEFFEGFGPEEGEPEFFFDGGFERWGHAELVFFLEGDGLFGEGDVLEVEQFEEAVETVVRFGGIGFGGMDLPVGGRGVFEVVGEPVHFGAVVGGFLGDDDIGSVGEDTGEAVEHAIGAADDVFEAEGGGEGLVEPGGEADAAGDAIEFGEGEAFVFSEDEVGPDDAGGGMAEGIGVGVFEEIGGFAGVDVLGDPRGGGAFEGAMVEVVGGFLEGVEDGAEGFEGADLFFGQGEGFRGEAPVFVGEEAFFWDGGSEGGDAIGGGLGRCRGSGQVLDG